MKPKTENATTFFITKYEKLLQYFFPDMLEIQIYFFKKTTKDKSNEKNAKFFIRNQEIFYNKYKMYKKNQYCMDICLKILNFYYHYNYIWFFHSPPPFFPFFSSFPFSSIFPHFFSIFFHFIIIMFSFLPGNVLFCMHLRHMDRKWLLVVLFLQPSLPWG